MKFLKLKVDDKTVLVNMDNVTEIHGCITGGCNLYFNTMASDEEQAFIKVDQDILYMEKLISEV